MTRSKSQHGHSLIELLVAMTLAALVGTIVLPAVFTLQARGLAEVSRADLQARAERLLRFIADDLREAAFIVGATPRRSDGTAPVLVHDSRSGDPAVTLSDALLAEDGGTDGDDALTIVRSESFFPPIHLEQPAATGSTTLRLDRTPNLAPGSSREIRPAPEAISHVLLANHRTCYPVGAAGRTLNLLDELTTPAAKGTELLGLRVRRFHLERSGSVCRLRSDDFTSDEILDDAIDALQFQYLLDNGTWIDQPDNPRRVRAVRLSLLVRDLRPDRHHRDTASYSLGNSSYGPFNDNYRRVAVSETIEVKNHALP